LEEIESLEYEIENKLYFENVKIMDIPEFLNWGEVFFQSIVNMVIIFEKTLTTEFKKSIEVDDDIEVAKKMRRSITRACKICKKSLEWEKELLSINPPEIALNLKESFIGSSKTFSVPLKELYQQVTEVINQIGNKKIEKTKTISINISGHINEKAIKDELKKLGNYSRNLKTN